MYQLKFNHSNTSWPYIDYTATVEFPDGDHQLQVQATWDCEENSGYMCLLIDNDRNYLANVDIIQKMGIDRFMKMVGHDPRIIQAQEAPDAEKVY